MSEKLDELRKLKSSGSYIPPAKLKELMAHVTLKKDSEEYQQLQWESLKKFIIGLINKVNKDNIKIVVTDLFRVNLIRGRGVIVKNLIKSQQVSTGYTDVYAALICVVNSKIPQVGKLLVTRLLMKYKRTFKREDVDQCKPTLAFLGQLVNFKVCNSTVVLQILSQLLENPTGFTIEMATVLLLECGGFLLENFSNSLNSVFDCLRNILNEGLIDSRTQFLVEECLEMRRKEYLKKWEIVVELDLVEEEDRITHGINLDDRLKSEDVLDVFQYDQDYEKHEQEYNLLKKDILGDTENEEEDDEYDDSSEYERESDASEKSDEEDVAEEVQNKIKVQIKDLTEQELTNFQKTVYLTIMSSMGPEEAAHKLLKIAPIDPVNKEYMLIDMVIKCCAQEKTYAKYYGLVGENLVIINRRWAEAFSRVFKENYQTCHRFETALLRNIGTFWGHMLASDKLGWEILDIVSLTEEDTTSSGRIFLKFMFLRMLEELGMKKLVYRVEEPYIRKYMAGIFPETNIENLRFSINFFTAIGLGRLTERMRETLEHLPPDASVENAIGDDSEFERGRSRKKKYTTSTSVSGSRSGSYSSYSSYTSSSRVSSRSGISYSRSGSRSPSYSTRSYSRSRSRNSSAPSEGSYSRSPKRRTAEAKPIPGRVSRETPPSRRNSFSRSPSPQEDFSIKRGRERSSSTNPTEENRCFKKKIKRSRVDSRSDIYRSDPNYSSINYGGDDGGDTNNYSSWNSRSSYNRRGEFGRSARGGRRGNVRQDRSRWNK